MTSLKTLHNSRYLKKKSKALLAGTTILTRLVTILYLLRNKDKSTSLERRLSLIHPYIYFGHARAKKRMNKQCRAKTNLSNKIIILKHLHDWLKI